MKFPVLYKKNTRGSIQFWEIRTVHKDNQWYVKTKYGQVGTEKVQKTYDLIKAGKNLGKANSTTIRQQAAAEAQSKWEKQLKRGYNKDHDAARRNEVDNIIQGGISPMLAHNYHDHRSKINFPCYVQPKLDGHRCIAIVWDGVVTLWTRSRKLIKSMPHLKKALHKAGKYQNIILDGELFSKKYSFEQLTSFIRSEKPLQDAETVEYHIYDCYGTDDFSRRNERTYNFCMNGRRDLIHHVKTIKVKFPGSIPKYHESFVQEGYEGVMVRNDAGPYENKRSYNLQKYKAMKDAEFLILGISKEGRGKLKGCVGSFLCQLANGKTFSAKMSGEHKMLRKYFLDHSLWKGKMLTVQFQEMTKYGVPRFPVGLRIREEIV